MSEPLPPPYPADTKAKGWRFELDLEKVESSDTWLRAKSGAVRGALLLLWAKSWQQVPCGSLPSDDELVSLLIDMPATTFTKHRAVLMRGWWLADDGRLYHDTIVTRVLAMLDKRATDAERAARNRAKRADNRASPPEVTPASRVTHAGLRSEFDTKHQAPEVNTNTPLSPLAGGNPVQTELKTEDQPKAKRQRKPKAEASTFTAWLADLKAKGEKAILPADPIFATASECGIPSDFVRFAWFAFRERYADSSKTYADWRATFRNAVKGNWLKLWWVNPETDAYELTTAGHQVRIALETRNATNTAEAAA